MKEKKIYTTLRYARERLGRNQEDFAKLIGCGAPNYANKENGKVPWSLDECNILRDHINNRLGLKGSEAYTVDTLFHADIVEKRITKRKPKNKTPA